MKTIELGTLVTTADGREHAYGGPHDIEGWESVSHDLRTGQSTIKCAAYMVAPVGTVTPDPKDSRIEARKIAREDREAIGASKHDGPWFAFPAGLTFGNGVTPLRLSAGTKTRAVEKAARRLAIADWHES